jgi:hypothetical protein
MSQTVDEPIRLFNAVRAGTRRKQMNNSKLKVVIGEWMHFPYWQE